MNLRSDRWLGVVFSRAKSKKRAISEGTGVKTEEVKLIDFIIIFLKLKKNGDASD